MVRLRVLGTDRLARALDAGAKRANSALLDAVRKGTRRVDRNAKLNLSNRVLKRRSGTLASSIRMQVDAARLEGRVGTDIVYARIHEYGGVTRPHIIKYRNAKALRFKMGGQWVFRQSVKHPGSRIPERPWLRPACEDAADEIRRDFEAAMTRTVVVE